MTLLSSKPIQLLSILIVSVGKVSAQNEHCFNFYEESWLKSQGVIFNQIGFNLFLKKQRKSK